MDKNKIVNHKDLVAYKKSYLLVKLVYEQTNSFPKEELYGLTSQMRRAAISVPTNISEGYVRGRKEYGYFLKVALGSSTEVDTLLNLSKDLGYLSETRYDELISLNTEVIKLLRYYINKISEPKIKGVAEEQAVYSLDFTEHELTAIR